MKTWRFFLLIVLTCLAARAQAQWFVVNITASCLATNGSGKIVPQRISNDTLIKIYAAENAATNDLKSLELLYGIGADSRGDVIQVVDRNSGALLWPVFALFFPVDLPSADGTRLERYTQLFNNQRSESIGSARISYTFQNTRTNVHGQLQFYLLPQGTNGLRMCEGTFLATKPFVAPVH